METIYSNTEIRLPNLPIILHDGDFLLKCEDKSISVKGTINFKWLPEPLVEFSGEIFEHIDNYLDRHWQLVIENICIGSCFITKTKMARNIKYKGTFDLSVKGRMVGKAMFGESSIPVSSVGFIIPNLRDFTGNTIREETGLVKSWNGRLSFTNERCKITLDKHFNWNEIQDNLKDEGGYAIQYVGSIAPLKGSMTAEEAEEILECFSCFISFLNGRQTSTLFLQGRHEGEVLWTDYTPYLLQQFQGVVSWPVKFSKESYEDIWSKFSTLWNDHSDKDFLRFAIHWYNQSNSNSGYSEGALVMAQIGLELIYNWLLIENKHLIRGNDANNISAGNKIRLLLGQLRLDASIPIEFTELRDFAKSKSLVDGPDAIVFIRNAIIHSQEEKRSQLFLLSGKTMYQTLQIAIYYIELSLLYILDFKGTVSSRIEKDQDGQRKQICMPWV